ncbi:putative phage tail protein [Wukongibacter sp. M2B1]|uniref:putative phage tail protein n=1 Tax=Wukongibacter sp. M2B1 TaxID=3088895 RepID=UPI003D7AF6FA
MSLDYKEILNSQLPDIYIKNNLEVNATGCTLNRVQSDVDILEREVNPITCETTGIDKWEQFFNLSVLPSEDIQTRRAKVIAKLVEYTSDENVISLPQFEYIIKNFTENLVVIEHYSERKITIKFTVKGLPQNYSQLKATVKKIKPSYIVIEYTSDYPSNWGDVNQSTWGNVKKFSWGDIKGGMWNG